MLKYKTEKGKTIVVICDKKLTEEEAIKKANELFKTRLKYLEAKQGYIEGNGLYWEKAGRKSYKVWAVYKRGAIND